MPHTPDFPLALRKEKQNFGKYMLQCYPGVNTLRLWHSKITDEEAGYLAATHTITSLDLTENDITAEGAKVLSGNSKITVLDLRNNRIGDEGAKALGANNTLVSLYLDGNGIGDEGAKTLGANNSLALLHLANNNIGDKGAKAIANNKNLVSLHLVNNGKITNSGKEALIAGLKNNKNLLYYVGPGDHELSDHIKENTQAANRYAASLTWGGIEFSNDEKTDIAERANAIAHELDDNISLRKQVKNIAELQLAEIVEEARNKAQTPSGSVSVASKQGIKEARKTLQ